MPDHPLSHSPFRDDRAIDRSSQYVDREWDDLGADPLEDLAGLIDRVRSEDLDW